jgi:cytochrome c biogenesis protein
MSAARNSAAGASTPSPASPFDKVYKFLSSTRFTIFLLSFIAVGCVVGASLPQQAPPEEYLQRYTETAYRLLTFLDLTNVFHSPWFACLIALLALNLLFCTSRQLSGFLKHRRPELPGQKSLSAMPLTFFLEGARLEETKRLFRGYKATVQGPGVILEKGRPSRYSIYVVHGSILIILLGSLIGLLFGYRGSVTLGRGETKDAAVETGGRRTIPLGFAIKLDDFKISFYPNGEPKEYASSIEVIDGKAVKKAEVRVNHPFSYKGANIYQASYGTDPVFLFDIGGEEVRLSPGDVYKKGALELMVARFERSVHDFGPAVQLAYLEERETRTAWFVKDVPRLREKELMGVRVRLNDVGEEPYTGLDVARDPGVWVVWTGFALILVGLFSNFFTYYRRAYLLQTPEGVLVAGTASRNKEAFREEFESRREKANGAKR